MIDLHLHTTASDGELTPVGLVARVAAAGITVMSVTDHDTTAGLDDARRAASLAGVQLVTGVEITAVQDGRDIHVLGYYIEPGNRLLQVFLREQRGRRVDRVKTIVARLEQLGIPIELDALLTRAAKRSARSIGRPQLARALVDAGYVATVDEAFERYLAVGQPAYVPRVGPSPAEVVAMIHRARGLASMAHPGVTRHEAALQALVDAGVDAIEVYHSDHDAGTRDQLLEFAARHGLLVSGGSDFHGDQGRARPLGIVSLPQHAYDALHTRAQSRRAH